MPKHINDAVTMLVKACGTDQEKEHLPEILNIVKERIGNRNVSGKMLDTVIEIGKELKSKGIR